MELDLSKITNEQQWVVERFSSMVGDVLTQIDASLPEGKQLVNLKKLLNRVMYDCRNDLLRRLPAPYGFGR